MSRNLSRALSLVLVAWALHASYAASCKQVEYTEEKCRSSSTVTFASQRIRKGSRDVRITLSQRESELSWHCGNSKERVAWGEPANQLRVNYLSDGNVQLTVYNCDDLSGPKKAGEICSDEAFSTACPGIKGSNHTCVFQVSTSTSFIKEASTTVEITGKLAKDIKGGASAEISGGISHTQSNTKIYKYEDKSYLFIPAGYRFCSFSIATSKKDVLAPTGYKYECSETYFRQTEVHGGCSGEKKCEKRQCISSQPAGSNGSEILNFQLAFCFVILWFFLSV